MPLDPQAQALLAFMQASGFIYTSSLTVSKGREMIAQMIASLPPGEPVANVENRLIPGPGGDLPIRIYLPQGNAPFPILIFLHTGAWLFGNLDNQDQLCRRITNRAQCIVLSVDYRLAPENPFPAALEDSYAATQWAAAHASEFQGDPTRLAVSGDSAGANMALGVALMARDQHGPKLAFQLALFPATDFTFNTPSMEEFAEGYNVTKPQMLWIRENYLSNQADWTNPLASPLFASDLSNLPPTLIITAEYDPLRDSGELYGKRLQEAGVPTKISRYDGMIHDFPDLFEVPGNRALNEIASALQTAFN